MRKKRLLSENRQGGVKRIALAKAVADTPLAKRMVNAIGQKDFALVKTMQLRFNARLVHWRDADGEVGTDPGWPT